MKASELRIGNYFEWVPWASMGIGVGQIRSGGDIDSYIDFKRPIPLTEERLVRFGFTKHKAQVSLSVGGELSIYFELNGFVIWQVNDSCYSLDRVFRNRKYNHPKPSLEITTVHKLQNVYFALKDEELEIVL